MKASSFVLIFIFLITISFRLLSQDTLFLKNPSFEDYPRKGGNSNLLTIKNWKDCGSVFFPGASPPDIHPVEGNAWGVSLPAHDGKTYLGMVARYDKSWESVSQLLEKDLKQDSCYQVSVWLCVSPQYNSGTRRSNGLTENFAQAISFYIWGGDSLCQMKEILCATNEIHHTDWKKYTFKFTPSQRFNSIVLQAYYYVPDGASPDFEPEPYNGHVMIDALSSIIEIPCD